MKLLLFRPYYGITINGDFHGDLGVAEYMPQVFPDHSLISAATIASQNSAVDLDVIDANAEKSFPKDVLKRMRNSYDLIILKASALTIKYDIKFVRNLKRIFPDTRIIMAGHIAKILKRWLRLNVPELDEIAEIPLERFIYQLVNGKNETVNINKLPTPDYTLFPYQKYVDIDGSLRVCLQMSKGCAAGCTYCPYTAFYGKNMEFRSPEKVIADIKQLLNLGVTTIQFRDQYFTWNKKQVVELCRMIIDEKLNFKWRCETRLESLNIEMIDLMVKAGLNMIFYGVESASPKTLESFHRLACETDKLKELIHYLNQKNVFTLAFYMIGFPDDTWDSIQETCQLANQLGSALSKFSIYTPCIFGETGNEDYPLSEITPDLFQPFENVMLKSPSRHLTLDQLRFLLDHVSIACRTYSYGLQNAYEYYYIHEKNYIKTVREITKRLESTPLFEL